jgi:GxxExxY protein
MRDVEELARLAIDAGLTIHKKLGAGLFESVYEAVLALELTRAGLSVQRQARSAWNMTGFSSEKDSAPIC